MRSLPTHTNRYTGEVLANAVQVCSACHLNFASTRAGDRHRVWRDQERVCISPSEARLEATVNKHGAIIYTVPKKTPQTPTQTPLLAPQSERKVFSLIAIPQELEPLVGASL